MSESDRCEADTGCRMPAMAGTSVPEGLQLGPCACVVSLLPCCAQLALPYWAKVIGTIKNEEKLETYVRVNVAFYNDEVTMIGRYGDFLILDALESGEFEVKVQDFLLTAQTYTVDVETVSDPSEFD